MRKIILVLSILLSGIYLANFIGAITVTKNSGEVLDNSTWENISSLTNKIDVSGTDIKLNGKLYVTGKICDNSGKCLGEKIGSEGNPGKSCKDILIQDNSYLNQDGMYWIYPNGGDSADAFQVYCDMTTDGGGWTGIYAATSSNYTAAGFPTFTWDSSNIDESFYYFANTSQYYVSYKKFTYNELLFTFNYGGGVYKAKAAKSVTGGGLGTYMSRNLDCSATRLTSKPPYPGICGGQSDLTFVYLHLTTSRTGGDHYPNNGICKEIGLYKGHVASVNACKSWTATRYKTYVR
ncbi:MAG: fibrinogen-like YCDxxxxGGGW domain-containing protein [Candidatus Gracilibacteria bacterium]|nr:fibrinogen-like YCDxxxxGGGW domain-containing protein [Candidatus Gracilibacteria bacterium]